MATYPKEYFETFSGESKPCTCFVLMPFGEPYDEVYQEVIKESLEEIDFKVFRADELFGSKPIMEDILKQIDSAEVVIADLTDRNPNVFYELGIAHCRKDNDKVILVTQDLEDIPFDLRPYRTIPYEPTISGAKMFKKRLIEGINQLTLKSFSWKGYQWQPSKGRWYISGKDDVLRGEILRPKQIPLIVNQNPLDSDSFKISFAATSSGPEVNVMFCFDGKKRHSGYHFWFWDSGIKLWRLSDKRNQIYKKNPQLKLNELHRIVLNYERGSISVEIDDKVVLSFNDRKPLHENNKLKFMGFNIYSNVKGHVDIQDFEISSSVAKEKDADETV